MTNPYFVDTIAVDCGRKDPYKRRELWFEFKGKMLMYGWCHADYLTGIWEPGNPWGVYEK